MQEIIGQKFYKWTVIDPAGRSAGGNILYKCRCDCGTVRDKILRDIQTGKVKQCRSCRTKERIIEAPDLTGGKYGSWLVLEKVRNKKTTKWCYKCRCDCGTVRNVASTDLRSGQSSRCDKCRATTHGQSNTNTYRIWQGILHRCSNPALRIYKYYGGRGIKVCDRWLSFENFLEDMGHRPEKLQIDRINVDGNYEPGNCRWATSKEQNNNKRRHKDKKSKNNIEGEV